MSPCLLCGSDKPMRKRFQCGHYTVCVCEHCGVTQLQPLPSEDDLARIYTDSYFSSGSESQGYNDYNSQSTYYARTFAEEIRRFRPYAPSGTVLDGGCGFGYFMQAAAEAGYEPYGADLSPEAVTHASALFPGKVELGLVEEAAARFEVQFDIVFLSHLVEHLTDPTKCLQELHKHISSHGVLVIITPNIGSLLATLTGRRWVSYKIPEHVAYYNRRTLDILLTSSGFERIVWESALQYYPLPFVAKRLRELVRPADRIVPPIERLSGLRDRSVRIPTGSIRVIARRV